jgi:hypothetical protein
MALGKIFAHKALGVKEYPSTPGKRFFHQKPKAVLSIQLSGHVQIQFAFVFAFRCSSSRFIVFHSLIII